MPTTPYRIYLGKGTASSGPPEIYATDQGTFAGPVQVAVADLTGDGIPDLIYADYVTGNVAVRLGNGNGTFGPEIDAIRPQRAATCSRWRT